MFVLFSISSLLHQKDDQPQEDLARSGCKTNKEVESVGILSHVGEPLEPTNKIWVFISMEES